MHSPSLTRTKQEEVIESRKRSSTFAQIADEAEGKMLGEKERDMERRGGGGGGGWAKGVGLKERDEELEKERERKIQEAEAVRRRAVLTHISNEILNTERDYVVSVRVLGLRERVCVYVTHCYFLSVGFSNDCHTVDCPV